MKCPDHMYRQRELLWPVKMQYICMCCSPTKLARATLRISAMVLTWSIMLQYCHWVQVVTISVGVFMSVHQLLHCLIGFGNVMTYEQANQQLTETFYLRTGVWLLLFIYLIFFIFLYGLWQFCLCPESETQRLLNCFCWRDVIVFVYCVVLNLDFGDQHTKRCVEIFVGFGDQRLCKAVFGFLCVCFCCDVGFPRFIPLALCEWEPRFLSNDLSEEGDELFLLCQTVLCSISTPEEKKAFVRAIAFGGCAKWKCFFF